MEIDQLVKIFYYFGLWSSLRLTSGFQIFPKYAPMEGGTQLTLYGNSWHNFTDINVMICDEPCGSVTYHQSLVCTVRQLNITNTRKSCNVTVSWSTSQAYHNDALAYQHETGDQSLIFLSPIVQSFQPEFGPLFGGTLLEVKGQNLNIGSRSRIFVAGNECDIIGEKIPRNEILKCSTRQNNKAACGHVEIYIGYFYQKLTNGNFCYKPDPVITKIVPLASIQSGGTTVTLSGTNLDSIASSQLAIIFNYDKIKESDAEQGKCSYKENTADILCWTPKVHSFTEHHFKKYTVIEADLEIRMNAKKIVIGEEIPKRIRIYRDPHFDSISSNNVMLSTSKPTLSLTGRDIPKDINKADINVMVGGQRCPVIKVEVDVLECDARDFIEKRIRDVTDQTSVTQVTNSTVWTTTPESVGGSYSVEIILDQDNNYVLPYPSSTTMTPRLTQPTASSQRSFMVTIEIGHYKRELGQGTVSLYGSAPPAFYFVAAIGAGASVLFIVLLLIATVILVIKLKNSRQKKKRINATRVMEETRLGSDVTTKPNLKQILDSVVDMGNKSEMENLIVSLDQLIIGRTIGTGNFGLVYEGLLMIGSGQPPQPVAIKTLKDPMAHNIDLVGLVQEAVIMREFHHPNVLGLIGLAEKEPGVPYVILPFMENHDLLTFVRDTSVTLTLHDVIKYGADIANGMVYLSQLRCVHRDLSARNCMLDLNHQVKVADFGLCRDVYERGYYKCDQKQNLPIRWMAIESIAVGSYSSKSDVWSYGVVLWEMLTRGMIPYPCVDGWEVITFLRHHRLDQPHFCPDVMYGHMMSCWDEDPDKRPSFEALQTELLQLIDGGLQVSSVSSITADPSNHVCLSVDGQTAGFSNYQNASTIPFDISKQNTKGRDQVIGHVKDEMGVVSILNFAERNTILNDVFITIPACYSLKDRSEPMPVVQYHQALHRNFSELRGEETEYV